jgi:hypothetical protein
VCGYALDVETPITFEHRYNLDVARQYLDEIVPSELSEEQLSQFFTLETIGACAADLEWGGVNYDVQRLVERYGSDAEARALLTHSLSPERDCRYGKTGATFLAACRALGLSTD